MMLFTSPIQLLAIVLVAVSGLSLSQPTPSSPPTPTDWGWTGSTDHPAIQACGCDTLDLMDGKQAVADKNGTKYGQVYLCNDSTQAYVQIYLGRGRQLKEALLWTGRVGKLPQRAGIASRSSFLTFSPQYRNSITLTTPTQSIRRIEDVCLILNAVMQDPFSQAEIDPVELYLKAPKVADVTVFTRTIADCCPVAPFPTPVGTAYHYAPPVLCDTILSRPLVDAKGKPQGQFSLYMTQDSMVFVFDLPRERLLGNTWIWTGNSTPPLTNSNTPNLAKYPIQMRPWRQHFVYKLPMALAAGKCKRVCVYAEVHEIDFLSQSTGFERVQPERFPVTGQQYCPPACCYSPVTL